LALQVPAEPDIDGARLPDALAPVIPSCLRHEPPSRLAKLKGFELPEALAVVP
jgi:hypothetical protein